MVYTSQPCYEGTVEEARIVFHKRGPVTYAKYISTVDGKQCNLIFYGVAILLKGDHIRLNFPPSITTGFPTQPFTETAEYEEIRGYLLARHGFDITADRLPTTYAPEIGFFFGVKTGRTITAPEIENVTRAITYMH